MERVTIPMILIWVLLVLFLLVRFFFTIKYRGSKVTGKDGGNAIEREGRTNYNIRRFVLLPLIVVFVFLNYNNIAFLKYFIIPFPQFILWIVFIWGLCGIALLIWVHIYLGKEWSVNLQITEEHRLIKSGPYSRVRHPMYTALFTIYLCCGILTCNSVIIILIILINNSISLRIPKEELMLTEKFGDEYRDYMKNTGRLFPKLGK